MKDRCRNLFHGEGTVSFSSSILVIICGLLFDLIILPVSNPKQAFYGFVMVLQGGFTDGIQGIGQMFHLATLITMTGLSVGFAFKTGLFNIDSSGQSTAGIFAAAFVEVKFTFLLAGVHCLVALMVALLAGAIWGFVPGFLKVFSNVDKMIASIMMSYINIYLVNMLIQKTVYDQARNQTLSVVAGANLPKAGLGRLFPGTNTNVGVLITILFAILIYITSNKVTFGYESKVCNKGPDTSKYTGISKKWNIVLSTVIAGTLPGTGGALLYLANSGKYMQVLDVIALEGSSGISVVLLGLPNSTGILFAGLSIGRIAAGGYSTQFLDLVPEVINIIIAAIIYCGALSLLFRTLIYKIQMRKSRKSEAGRTAGTKGTDGTKKQKPGAKTGKEGTR